MAEVDHLTNLNPLSYPDDPLDLNEKVFRLWGVPNSAPTTGMGKSRGQVALRSIPW